MSQQPNPQHPCQAFQPDGILQGLTTAILVVDAQLTIVFSNNASGQLFGQNSKRLANLHFVKLFHHLSLPAEKIRQTLEQQQEFSDSEVHAVLADSRPVWLTLSCSVLNQNGRRYALIEFKQIDQQKRIAQENQHEHQHLAARSLIRGLAHEIKNPLGGIRGAAQLLQKQLPDDDLRQFTGLIMEQSDRLRDLVDRLLGPNKTPKWQHSNIHRLIDNTLKLITMEHLDRVHIKRDYDPSIPEIVIDPQLIQQALLNIFNNAVHAMNSHDQPPLLTVTTRIRHRQNIHGRQHKRALEIKIIDNGPGIDTDLIDTLFFPLVSTKRHGSGLGLSISQTLLHQHQGRIECDSWPGHTEFSLLIPFNNPVENNNAKQEASHD